MLSVPITQHMIYQHQRENIPGTNGPDMGQYRTTHMTPKGIHRNHITEDAKMTLQRA